MGFCFDIVYSGGIANDVRDRIHWNLTEHESQCGNRTLPCHLCQLPVRLKEMEFHLLSHQSNVRLPPSITPEVPQQSTKQSPQPSKQSTPSQNREMTEPDEQQLECPI